MFKFVHVWGICFRENEAAVWDNQAEGHKEKYIRGQGEAMWSAHEKKLGRGEGLKPDPGKKWPRKKSPWAV